MTTQIKFRLATLLALLIVVSSSFSQSVNVSNVPVSVEEVSYNKPYTNVVTAFEKMFSNAENVSWYSVRNDFGAKFTINDLKYRVLLNAKGNLVYKITYGQEKHLPIEVRKAVKMQYFDFKITAASLVEEANRTIWVIHLEDDFEYVVVRVENDELHQNLKYKKQG